MIATGAAALLGAVAGSETGRSLDRADALYVRQISRAADAGSEIETLPIKQ